MQLSKALSLVAVPLAMLLALAAGPANATLIGDTVGCNITGDSTFSCSSATAVVDGGVEFQVGNLPEDPFIDVDIGASTVHLAFIQDGILGGTIINLTDLNWVGVQGEIIGVTLDYTDVTGFDQGDLSYGPDSLAINLIETSFVEGATGNISLKVTHAVPEPTTLLLLGVGLAGLGFARRRH